ncbi:MAG TPA: hypothetical protein VIX83_03190 [Candidatus Cybelea sp.]
MVTFEAQIIVKRDNPEQLAADVRAISEFIERRNANERSRHFDAVKAAERIVRGGADGRSYAA